MQPNVARCNQRSRASVQQSRARWTTKCAKTVRSSGSLQNFSQKLLHAFDVASNHCASCCRACMKSSNVKRCARHQANEAQRCCVGSRFHRMRTTHCCIDICVNTRKTMPLNDTDSNASTHRLSWNVQRDRCDRSFGHEEQRRGSRNEVSCKHKFFENMLRNLMQRVQIPQVYVRQH